MLAQPPASRTVDRCRGCGSDRLLRYLDLGRTPLANSYLSESSLGEPEFSEELCLQLCRGCGLSQLTKVVAPDLMFRNYLYVSATTATIREHFGELARSAAAAAGAKPGDLAVDVASNDGTLLKAFQDAGLKAVGVDPAENLAAEANAAGLTTECAYWDGKTAAKVVAGHGRPAVITACNVFAHADDLHAFMDAVGYALAPGGLFVVEAPYGIDFIEKSEFDTAYHEHLSYLSMTPMSVLMGRHGFAVVDCEYFPEIHGGTMRYYCARAGEREVSRRVVDALAREEAFGVKSPAVYEAFAARVLENRAALLELIRRLRGEGKTVWAYGASAKGNTLMNFFGLTRAEVPCAVDDNPKKWGFYTPGGRMKIVGPERLKSDKPDYLLLLAWNFEKEIRARCAAAGFSGGFVVPVPRARLVAAEKGER
jgi:SAM-dependent methyltransferase